MKSHKKLIALIVALTFVLSLAVPMTAGAATAEENAAAKLVALGILAGYPDGSLGLEKTITRAEFAKVAVITAGLEKSADLLKNTPSKFSDVKTGEWYTGWINLAAARGFVKGDPAGTFRPSDPVTMAEVVTVMLRILGYNDNLPGSWPINYIVKAAELDVTKGLTFDAKAPATRGQVAMMTSKTLEQNLVVYSKDKEEFQFKLDGDNKISLIDSSFESALKSGYFQFLKGDADGKFVASISGTDVKVSDKVSVSGAADILGLEGSPVKYVVNKDNEIVYIEQDTVTFVEKDKVIFEDKSGTVYATIDGKSYKLADTFYWVGEDLDADQDGAVDLAAFTAEKVRVALNKDNKAVGAYFFNYGAASVVDEVDAEALQITYKTGSAESLTEIDADDDTFLVIKDGKIAKIADIKTNDLVWVFTGAELWARDFDYVIVAQSNKAAGKLTASSVTADELTVGGTKYKVDLTDVKKSSDGGKTFGTYSIADSDFNKEVTLYFSPSGKVSAVVFPSSTVESLYGVVVSGKITVPTADGNKYYVKIFKTDGTTVSYAVKSDVVVPDLNTFTKFELNSDGVIKAFASVETKTAQDALDTKVKLTDVWYAVTSNTVAVWVGTKANGEIEEDPAVVAWKNVKEAIADGNLNGDTVTVVLDGNKVKFIAFTEKVVSTAQVGLVAGKGRNADGYYYVLDVKGDKFTYNIDGESVTSTVYNTKTLVDFRLTNGKVSYIQGKTGTTGTVTSVNKTDGYFKLGDTTYVYVDSETVIYDVSGTTYAKVTFDKVAKGKTVEVWIDSDGNADYILIK